MRGHGLGRCGCGRSQMVWRGHPQAHPRSAARSGPGHSSIRSSLIAFGAFPPPFPYQATQPFGVPLIWSYAFWGGVWGLVYGAVERHFPEGILYYVVAFLFGAIVVDLVLWFVVFP